MASATGTASTYPPGRPPTATASTHPPGRPPTATAPSRLARGRCCPGSGRRHNPARGKHEAELDQYGVDVPGASAVPGGAVSAWRHRGFGDPWMISGYESFELGKDRRVKALIGVYRVSVSRGSESRLSWHMISALAAIGVDVHVITDERSEERRVGK